MTTKSIHADSTAGALFTSQARLAVLKLLLLNAGQRFYLREIAARTHLPVQAVQRELARLEAGGLLTASAEGNRKYYHANRQSPVFAELRTLLVKTVGLGDLLRKQLAGGQPEIVLAFLFGSYARGTDSASSDIDLMVIGSSTGRSVASLLAPAREALGREINPVLMSRAEFRQKAIEGNHFLLTVLREPKIYMIGGEDELAELVGVRASEASPDKPQGDR